MRNIRTTKFILSTSFILCASFAANAQEKTISHPLVDNNYNGTAWALATVLLFAFGGLIYVFSKFSALGKEDKAPASVGQRFARLNAKFFTKAIPLEKEADHLLDHDYDGIQELDNSLPPWWKYGFYFSIVCAVFYILRYHVWKTGPDPEQEYNTEMAIATKQIEEYRKKAGDMVDEKTVTLADAAGIAEGKKIFQSNCFACHGQKGEGGVGPNLTDNYWLHGGTINDVFKTIKYGVPEKGMQSWQKTYSPSQIKDLASYVKSLAGTNPPNPKAPQGDPYEEKASTNTAAKDSTSVAKK
ncbi:cbb3-type cytochrome c oxidase N-terminal domain-containing protein [Flavisolibacter ginsenosidimutans]|uniref:C-type cytochrome n=1 Tax=Flavisolibacter ginsenosidimutans TaxID=661481 RepID=A0A5B8UE73_9BACT|nr:cbb3-type cytochrome c oxidase N-terminal domain-containing protein [Flavisolibacter ginsenosidimutans]QEC54803.1 c-type cytochrome [Flavisolibacter ginsenosidimutans]